MKYLKIFEEHNLATKDDIKMYFKDKIHVKLLNYIEFKIIGLIDEGCPIDYVIYAEKVRRGKAAIYKNGEWLGADENVPARMDLTLDSFCKNGEITYEITFDNVIVTTKISKQLNNFSNTIFEIFQYASKNFVIYDKFRSITTLILTFRN